MYEALDGTGGGDGERRGTGGGGEASLFTVFGNGIGIAAVGGGSRTAGDSGSGDVPPFGERENVLTGGRMPSAGVRFTARGGGDATARL
jgi:hypothetical protein